MLAPAETLTTVRFPALSTIATFPPETIVPSVTAPLCEISIPPAPAVALTVPTAVSSGEATVPAAFEAFRLRVAPVISPPKIDRPDVSETAPVELITGTVRSADPEVDASVTFVSGVVPPIAPFSVNDVAVAPRSNAPSTVERTTGLGRDRNIRGGAADAPVSLPADRRDQPAAHARRIGDGHAAGRHRTRNDSCSPASLKIAKMASVMLVTPLPWMVMLKSPPPDPAGYRR